MQTTSHDWVISGHGWTRTDTNPRDTLVPAHIRLHLLAPPGASLSMRLGQALERGECIPALTLRQNGRSNRHSPTLYLPGQSAPNLSLHVIDAHDIGTPTVPHVIGVVCRTRHWTRCGHAYRTPTRWWMCTGPPAAISMMTATVRWSTSPTEHRMVTPGLTALRAWPG